MRQSQCGSNWTLAWVAVAIVAIVAMPNLLFAEEASSEAASAAGRGGIRKLRSQHLTLFTDLPARQDVDELPHVFDLAVAEWVDFFGLSRTELDDWHVIACVIRDQQRFRDYGLLPDSLPPFLHGYQRDNEVWVYERPGNYYTRHLLLHEGTHAVMSHHFGRGGPDWYREGMAELLATHRYRDGQLKLAYFPKNREEVEQWGRIKIVSDNVEAGKIKTVREILAMQPREFLDVEAYAWAWAFASFCQAHPLLRTAFPELQAELRLPAPALTVAWLKTYQSHQSRLDAAWKLFLANLDYGYDLATDEIHYVDNAHALTTELETVEIDATKGWQSTGLVVPAGCQLQLEAAGRYQVGNLPKPWWCEPPGVTIEYHQHRPLGMLIGALADVDGVGVDEPFAIGRQRKLSTERGGVLFLRINERADRLRDNAGSLSVRIQLVP